MKLNKHIAFLLALCLCVGFGVQAFAAGTTVTLDLPDELPEKGETFTAVLTLEGNTGFASAQLKLGYDARAVKCTAVKTGDALKGMLAVKNPDDGTNTAVVAAAGTQNTEADGELAVFTFEVLKPADPKLKIKEAILTDADGNALALAVNAEQPRKESSSGGFEEAQTEKPRFADLPQSHWAYAQIEKAVEKGLIKGYDDGTFRPDEPVTRAQFVTMLCRMAGQSGSTNPSAFADVPQTHWAAAPVAWAAENGFVKGTSPSAFDPNGMITREQAMTVLFRYAGGVSGMEAMLGGIYQEQFADSASIHSWARPAVYWAVYNEILTGDTATTLAPTKTATRAQTAVIFLRYMEKINFEVEK
ncbi:MAG: S-layer homology domain-containing protein [Oscillospiraceae bacterium]|nr:S-layer homology domain-containing protein [Oscillospiraceae bacterium]